MYVYVVGSVLLTALGSWSLFFRYRARAILLVGPLVVGVGANLAGQYPIAVRLWVFAAPLMILLLTAGISAMVAYLSVARRESLTIMATLLIGVPVAVMVLPSLWQPIARGEHSRPIVEAIRTAREPTDALYVYPSSVPAWLVYSSDWQEKDNASLRKYMTADAVESPPPRSTSFGVETLGAVSGAVVGYRQEHDLEVSEGWGDHEVDRILQAARGCVWTFESHVEDPEREAINAALVARGFSAAKSVGDDNARATRFCRAASAGHF